MTLLQARSVQDVVDHYVERRGSGGQISTRQAILTIRLIVPDRAVTDRELADMVAASAIRKGCVIAFDGGLAINRRNVPGHAHPRDDFVSMMGSSV